MIYRRLNINLTQYCNIKINTKEGNMVSLYHKFVPYLKWDYSRFDDHLYLEEYPNVPIVKK